MAKKSFLLANALHSSSHLRGSVAAGIGALPKSERSLIAQDQRSRVGDSLDLDEASRAEHPNSNRWDYLLSLADCSQIIGLEPHSARDDEIGTVIAKKRQALQYLQQHLPSNRAVRRWYWVSPGPVRFAITEKAIRRLSQAGITFAGRLVRDFGS